MSSRNPEPMAREATAELERGEVEVDRSGSSCAAVLIGLGIAGSFVFPAGVQLLFSLAAVSTAILLLTRGRAAAVVELGIWMFVAAPLVRRIADWRGGYHPSSLILLAGPLVCLTGVVALAQRRHVSRWAALVFIAVGLCVVYASIVGLGMNGPKAAGTQFVQWVSPICGGLLVLLAPVSLKIYLTMLRRVTRWVMIVAGGYGIVQFFFLPAWDATWMRNVSNIVDSFGKPKPLEVRVFSIASSPGPMANVLVILLLIAVAMDKKMLDYVGIVAALTTTGLSQARSSWIFFLAGLLVLAMSSRLRKRALYFAAGTTLLILLTLLLGGSIASTVTDRVTNTTRAGSKDLSFQARTTFQARQLPAALSYIPGDGFGSSGTAVRDLSAATDESSFANTDSGYLEELRVFGAVFGVIFIGATVAGGFFTWRAGARQVRDADGQLSYVIGLTAGLVPIALYFGTATFEAAGLLFWTGVALNSGISGRLSRRNETPFAVGGLNDVVRPPGKSGAFVE